MHRATKFSGAEAIELLLFAGASVDARNNDLDTPLHCMMKTLTGLPDQLRISNCLSVDPQNISLGLLFLFGADPNAINNKGQNALHTLAMNRELYWAGEMSETVEDIARTLIKAGTLRDTVDKEGHTPRQLFERTGNLDVAELFDSMDSGDPNTTP